MGRYKICVYAISKNEERFVDRWMDAVGEADMVVVADTGSTDRTVEKLRARGAAVYEEVIRPWRFDAARNAALGHVPEDVDICVSNDLDEVFEKGWRQRLEEVWRPDCTRARYLFTYSFRADGQPERQFAMEKIHCRHGFRWVHPVHEVLEYTGGAEKTVWVEGLVLVHRPDPGKPRSQYLPLLELSIRENPQDDRTMFWLGREYFFHRRYDDCILTLRRHLAMPSAAWDEERSASMRYIAAAYEAKSDWTQARAWLFRAAAECPRVREPYLQMAKLGYRLGDWPLVFLSVEEALKLTLPTGSYLVEPEAWGAGLYDLGAIGCYRLGLYDKARLYGEKACELLPGDQRLRRNLELILQKAGEGHE